MPTNKNNEKDVTVKPKAQRKQKSEPVEPIEETPTEIENAYIVQEGDSIADVATMNGISVQTLVQKNRLRSFNLEPGQKLII